MCAYFFISHRCTSCDDIIPYIRDIPEVSRCQAIAGDMDWLVYVQANSVSRVYQIREQLDLLKEVSRVETLMVLYEAI
ncbi:Lrp/AsnC ligand binding domain-containing protein [Microbulbifer epialgicus]|uniref:Lrp/AsnC ligand binding domain-containing protein n=1 Tax=Microbulbifer epialgicus TaxID=393907 RepID=A0ABV4P659_9GAMM